ncbi:MAG: hypothetical protein J6P45_08710 [Lachnospiraceae bacterium]|nr:hypothetical protein [Lachnospiraceae bacterium]
MKIDFSQLELNKAEAMPQISNAGKKQHLSAAQIQAGGVFTDIGSNALDNLHAYSKKSRSAAEKIASVETHNEQLNRNYMAVMANTMSKDDFKELVEKGYAPGQMQPKDAVNSLDRMKVKLAEAGVEVAGYTDTVSNKEASKITGSQVRANKITGNNVTEAALQSEIPTEEEIEKSLEKADLPVTDDNIKDIKNAFEIASQLKPLSEAGMVYMVENEMEPTIENVYEAQFSTGGSSASGRAGYFYEGTGYLSAAADTTADMQDEMIRHQIEEVIKEAGFEVNGKTETDAGFLIEKGIPLTKDTLQLYSDIKDMDIRADIAEMTDAIAMGKRPRDAYLIKDYRNIKQQRQLKETELAMTHEANRKLLKSDYEIDTSKLENEVEALKKDEKAVWDLLDETMLAKEEIGKAPAELISRTAFFGQKTDFFLTVTDRDYLTLSDLKDESAVLSRKYEAMEATYEAVGTEVRADLGDSIKKAFNNVDLLIKETGLEISDENRRAVRILGYGSMEISKENVDRVKEADGKVNDMIKLLTPKNVLKLIRENVNPLSMNIDELNERLFAYEEQAEEQELKFAQYLVKMRNSGEVDEKEAASYIGIYRFIDRLNKTDGAAIGSLLNQNAELSVKNLLTAMRTSRRGHMDFLIDESFGGVDAVADETILKIDTQISTAFAGEYYEEEARKFAEAAKAEERIYRLFEEANIEPNADDINAAAELLSAGGSFFKNLFSKNDGEKTDRLKKAADKAYEALDDPEEFSEAYDEMVNEEIIAAFEGERLDIRILQTTNRVTAIQKSLSETENYQVPVEINGEITSINLQIRHGENRGSVDIYFESGEFGFVSASFSITGNATTGIVVCGRNAGYAYVNEHKEELLNAMSFDERTVTMDVIRADERISDRPVGATDGERTETAVLYKTAKAFIGGFIYEDQQ